LDKPDRQANVSCHYPMPSFTCSSKGLVELLQAVEKYGVISSKTTQSDTIMEKATTLE
jgi:hypothetical protein